MAPRYAIVHTRMHREELTLEALAEAARLHPLLVERYVEVGVLEPVEREGERMYFDASALSRLRMIGRLRESLSVNLAGVWVALDLLDRLYELRRENELLRSRL